MASTNSRLGDLAPLVGGVLVGDGGTAVRDITNDSRQAGPGTLYVAIVGSTVDGHDFAGQAVAAGASAVMGERRLDITAPQIVVDDARTAMAPAAAAIFDHPSRSLSLVGVTGTNGKTTVTHMVESIVARSGGLAGLIGTVHTRVGGDGIHNIRTTPESCDFHRLLRRMADSGATVVAAEISSHALALHRVDATTFAVGAFTNLSQDHLDFHGDMDSYFQAKAELFNPDRTQQAVIATGDEAGRRLARLVEIPFLTIGPGSDVRAEEITLGVERSSLRMITPAGDAELVLPVGGAFNVDNALVAAGCGISLGFDLDGIVAGLEQFPGVPGRFEVVKSDEGFQVVVDYAHTPDGIRAAIETVRSVSPAGRIIVVFGAGGDRDRAKRPQMGMAAEAADVVFATSDNPRSEDADAIIDEVMTGFGQPGSIRRITDRRQAIRIAISEAAEGDVILILGRGHELGQEILGRTIPFEDRLVAREAVAGRRPPDR